MMRWVFAVVFGILGFLGGVVVAAAIVMFLNDTLAIPGIDYYTGLPFALAAVIILVLLGGTFVGGTQGYRLGARLKSDRD
ncbi:MAG: hypothetical protein ABID87_03220 [Chloroflexota bacterium]